MARNRSRLASLGAAWQAVPAWAGPAIVLAMALVFGGGTRQGYWSDAAVQLASLPLLGFALWRIGKSAGRERIALWLVAGILGWPLLQLIPLPPQIWTLLPGRDLLAAGYELAEIETPWLGVSLSPEVTWRSFMTLLPAAAIFLCGLSLPRESFRVITLGLVGFGLVSVLIGLAQLAQGPTSGLRFYLGTSFSEAVGLFANRNHYAALLYCVLPFAAAWTIWLAADRRWKTMVALALCLLVVASLILGIGMARSRAGIGLAMLAILGSVFLALGRPLARGSSGAPDTKRSRRFIYAGVVIGLALAFQFASLGIIQRLEADFTTDARWEISEVTLTAIRDVQPFGSGFGTFEWIYRMHEGAEQLSASYVNHAHNDYLELILEGGWPAAALIVGCLGWLFVRSVQVWRRDRGRTAADGGLDTLLRRAAVLSAWLLCLHSAVDYPLRTTTLMTLFALFCAMVIVRPKPLDTTHSPRPADDGRTTPQRQRAS